MTTQMSRRIAYVTFVVKDYDEAKAWYRDVLGFADVEDTPLQDNKRWVVVAPSESAGTGLLLAKASSDLQQERIGDQAGGRVFLFLHTDDFWRDYRSMQQHGVRFCEQPREERYGRVVVFEDLYGNRWDLLQLS
jgi:catechol 2,3-dioxygenase-like lactoylglutathione lyase family enzyme